MIDHHGRHLVFHLSRLPEVGKLYWSHTLRNLGYSLVAIFVPLYLSGLGYGLTEILVYLVAGPAVWAILIYPSMLLMGRFGANRIMALSFVFNILWFVLLTTLPDQQWPLWLIGIAWGAFVAPYWSSFRYAFAQGVKDKRAGRYVAGSSALLMIAVGLAPALGGLLANLAGFRVLYLVAIGLMVLASLPLLFGNPVRPTRKLEVKRLRLRPYRGDYLANAGSTIDDSVHELSWPMLIFLVVPTYAGVGLLSSLGVITAIATAFFVGIREEGKGAKHYIREGAAVTSLTNVARLLASAPGHVAGANFMTGIANALVGTSFSTRYYEHIDDAKEGQEYLFGMQLASALAYVLIFSILLVLSLVWEDRQVLWAGVAMAIPGSLLIARMR